MHLVYKHATRTVVFLGSVRDTKNPGPLLVSRNSFLNYGDLLALKSAIR
jgi:hypothetical protein